MSKPTFHVESFHLDNGMGIHIMPRPDSSRLALYAQVGTGSIHEGEFLGYGLSHFLEHMMFEGCEGFPNNAVADTVNALGGYANAFTDYQRTVYQLELPSESLAAGLDILAAMLMRPLFPEARFQAEKKVIQREREMSLDQPNTVLLQQLCANSFLVHPLRHPIIGYRELIDQVDRDIMCGYYRRRYTPGRSDLVIVGPVSIARTLQQAAKRFEAWPRRSLADQPLPEEPPQCRSRREVHPFPDPQARLAVGVKIPPLWHPDIPAIDILNGILGQNDSSRLLRKLRQEQQLAIQIQTFCFASRVTGLLGIFAAAEPGKLAALEQAIGGELETIRQHGVSVAELNREIIQQTAALRRDLKSNNALALNLLNSLAGYGQIVDPEQYLDQLKALTPENIQTAARRYFAPEQLTWNLLVPPEQLRARRVRSASGIRHGRPERRRLQHGSELILQPDSRHRLVDLAVLMPGGQIWENRRNAGISRLLSALLLGGTRQFPEAELAERLDDNAVEYRISPGDNSLMFRFNCPEERLPAMLELVKSILLESTFPATVFERERANLLEQLKSRRLQPLHVAQEKALALLYGDHPCGLPHLGSEASLQRLKPTDIGKFYRTLRLPGRTVFGAAGAFDHAVVTRFFEELDAAIPWAATEPEWPPPPRFPQQEQQVFLPLPREQAAVIYAVPACDNLSPDRFVFDLLQHVLNGLSANLFKTVREDNALAYATGANAIRGFFPGVINFYAGTAPDQAPAALELLKEERRRLGRQGLGAAELAAAKAALKQDNAEMQERSDLLLLNLLLAAFYRQELLLPDELDRLYDRLSLTEVNACLKRYFAEPVGVGVITGPEAR